MRHLLFISGLAVLTALVSGCQRDASDQPTPVSVSAQDPHSDVRLMTEAPASEISIADRLWITDRCTWETSAPPSFEPRSWGDTDWTVIETINDPIVHRDGTYTLERRTHIEPFLPGNYEIPAAAVRLTLDEEAEEPKLLRTDSIEVAVLGVLPDEDRGDLNPIADATIPDEPDQTSLPYLWIGLGSLTLVIAGGVLYAASTSKNTGMPHSIADELEAIREGKLSGTQDAYERLLRIFDKLDTRLRSTSEFAEMIRACEEARFSGSPQRGAIASPQRIAAHALDLLGHDVSDREGGVPA